MSDLSENPGNGRVSFRGVAGSNEAGSRMLESPRRSMLRRSSYDGSRHDHFQRLVADQQLRNSIVQDTLQREEAIGDDDLEDIEATQNTSLNEFTDENLAGLSESMIEIQNIYRRMKPKRFPMEIRMDEVTYSVQVEQEAGKIMTIYNSSFIYPIVKFFKRLIFRQKEEKKDATIKNILDRITLRFVPGKSYLILGPPGSGKSSLLRTIAGILHPETDEVLSGQIKYNGKTHDKHLHTENAFSYIDQLDKHAPRLTVRETFGFAFQCKVGCEMDVDELKTPAGRELLKKKKREALRVTLLLSALGLREVGDTFVGDTEIRGVSGGQRRRVTVGEMIYSSVPVLCGDEISTGLDATSTYDIIRLLVFIGKTLRLTRIISLLQPSPETVSLFDEVILLAEGHILYSGPIEEVEEYFANIGYEAPEFVDVADFLQMVSTKDGEKLYNPPEDIRAIRPNPLSIPELAEYFRLSQTGKDLRDSIDSAPSFVWSETERGNDDSVVVSDDLRKTKMLKQKYANNVLRSTYLIFKRFMILWIRDKRVIYAGLAKNIIMGISVGGVFFNAAQPYSILGVFFQAGLFIMLGAMQSASGLIEDRIVYYKHTDANFYSAWPFIFGRTLSQMPSIAIDTIMFSTYLYFMVGLGGRQAENFFIYLALLYVFALTMSAQLSVFASFSTSSGLQTYSACILLLMILFGGFIVSPAVIPNYFQFLFWWNPFAWAYRGLVVNEFWCEGTQWENPGLILRYNGLTLHGKPYGREWVGLSFAYMLPYFLFCTILTAIGLTFLRHNPKPPQQKTVEADADAENEAGQEEINIPFKPVTLTFEDVCYDVVASTSKETLQLLTNVNGMFRSGKMCALMGSSGAGKTTLMDVIALRKRTGTVSGEIRLNGHLQEDVSFRRCSGYVEQFDVQTPELTVFETVLFSARLRLDPSIVQSGEERVKFVNHIIQEVDLSDLSTSLIGTDESGGLSFEQKKRLSIAVELAASPSIIFLDEPTSGLDARSALLVVKALRRIADNGRTVCATIHQPSSAVFERFDELLLLKKGGRVVFHGELGKDCEKLVRYFEERGAPKIDSGENPANWMLRVMTSGSLEEKLPQLFMESSLYSEKKSQIEEIKRNPDPNLKIEYDSQFAVPWWIMLLTVKKRIAIIYWRSPAYNLSRIMVSLGIAVILASMFFGQTGYSNSNYTEQQMNARLSVIFLSFIIIGIMAMLSVLPVMKSIRNMFYRHQDAGMYEGGALALSIGVVEQGYILLSSTLFVVVFLACTGLGYQTYGHYISFWAFFTFNYSLYSFFGQAFVCLVQSERAAFILCSVFMGLQNFFSGLVARPQLLVGGFFAIPYYITPGHYVYEGLVTSLYYDSDNLVVAERGSPYETFLVEQGTCNMTVFQPCTGTASEYVDYFYGGQFTRLHWQRNIGILAGIFVVTRAITYLALRYIRPK